MVSYGYGSDAISFIIQKKGKSAKVPDLNSYFKRREYLDYPSYLQQRKFLSSFNS